ncbi:hypothetical protein SHIRM173S_05744 [Streptomyces hirsutus]
MDSHGQYEQRVVWAVVDTGIGPLLLAATREGLVNVVFRHTDGRLPRRQPGGGPGQRTAGGPHRDGLGRA